MKKYTANQYFNNTDGLIISDEQGNTVINIKADSSNEIANLGRKILAAINEDYYNKKARMADNDQNFEWGLITKKEHSDKVIEIVNS